MQLRSVNDRNGNLQRFMDIATAETVALFQPCVLDWDFVEAGAAIPAAGAPVAGDPWAKKFQGGGAPTVGILANIGGGIVAAALDATSEKQEATLYSNDQRTWDVTKGLFFEARAALSVLPSAAQVEAVLGLQSAWIDGPDNASFYLRFQALASGAINLQSKDGVNTFSLASGITLAAGVFHIFSIDATDPTNVIFAIDGAQVNGPNTISFAATGGNAILQPYGSVYKASGVGVGTLQIDKILAGMNRQ